MDYYDKAYNHTRSRILREVAEGWESPVPQAAKSDEGNAHSLEKLAAVSEQSEREGMHWGFGVRGDDSELKFPEEPAARVTNTGSIRGGRVSAELPGLNQSRVFGSEGSVDLGTDGVSVGYASDFAFVNSRDASERETLKKQHGGTVKIDGAVGEAWGEVDSEIEELGDIELQSKVDSLKVGRVMTRGQGLTKDTVIRRELPALVNKPVSAVEVDARRFRIGGGYQGVEPSGRDSYQSGLRSGAAALDADTIDALIQAASFQAIPATLSEDSAQGKPLSTFSLHVSDVSFKLAQAALAKGEWPDAERIRIEEFVNAFDYGDPLPSQEEKVAANLEQTIHPFLQQRNLLRVSMRTAATGRNSSTPLHLTFLLDNSGSMERADRRETVQKAFALLASMLQPADQITLISFARQPRLLADRMSGDQVAGLVETVRNLPSEGGTNLEAALALAFEKAKEQQLPGAQNRIILLTDGAANLGDAEPQRLADKVEQMRDAGIAFDAAGIGTEGLNDEILEALTRKGDGRYYLLDKADDVDGGFAKQIAGALRPAAGNVKVQIEFNPDRVGKYKLLGFEKHRLKKEDFRNDKIDAAELAAAEAGVAVYQIETKPDGKGNIGSAFVRFRDMATGEMTERRWTIPYQSHPSRPAAAAPSMQVAAVAVMLGAKLKGDALGEVVDLEALLQIVSELPEAWREKPRVVELKTMLESARAIVGE
jgi:Mg-chelatase subunit ChlD